MQATTPLELKSEAFLKHVVHETYTDVQNSEALSGLVSQYERKAFPNLAQLSGIEGNQLRCPDLERTKDGIDVLLRVAEVNLDLLSALLLNGCDVDIPNGAEALISDKLRRSGIVSTEISKFVSLLELNGVPDIVTAVASGSLALPAIWKLRQKRLESCQPNWETKRRGSCRQVHSWITGGTHNT